MRRCSEDNRIAKKGKTSRKLDVAGFVENSDKTALPKSGRGSVKPLSIFDKKELRGGDSARKLAKSL